MAVANIGIKENKKAWGYFGFTSGHSYSDNCYIELQASRDVPFEDVEVLVEYDAIDEDSYFVENYKPEQIFDALKKATKLIEQGWIYVELIVHFNDKETKSYAHFSITSRTEFKEVSIRLGATLRQKGA